MFLLYLPLAEGGVYLLLTGVPSLGQAAEPGQGAITSRGCTSTRWHVPGVAFFGLVLGGLVFVLTVPRVLNLFCGRTRSIPCTASTTGSTG